MIIYFSVSTGGFYTPEINASMPDDVVEISEDLYASLLDGQSNGKVIAVDVDGMPFLADPPSPTAAEIVAANTSRKTYLLSAATLAMAPLQDAVDLGVVRPDEQALLTEWKTFRVAVNRIDLSANPVSWPIPPQGLPAASTPAPGSQ